MAVIERNIVLMSKTADGNQTIDLPITRLGNVENTADVKAAPVVGDYVPVIDQADGGQMKKTTVEALAGYVAETTGLRNLENTVNTSTILSSTQPTSQPTGGTWLQILD